MTDKISKKKRSYVMSRVKSKDTTPEVKIRKFLFSHGLRYRKNVHSLPGKPDIVLKKYKTIIMFNGCFWHGHENCKNYKMPATNVDFWKNKIEHNKIRDKHNINLLEEMGWEVIVIWGCEINNLEKFKHTMNHLINVLRKKTEYK